MIHKIKALYDNGMGLSIRQIAKELNMSRNTVSKYINLNVIQIASKLEHTERSKLLDEFNIYIKHQLAKAPGLSAVKLQRRLEDKFGPLNLSDRTLRRYVAKIKKNINVAQVRYYEPVLDRVPGAQCQVDPGELRNVMIGGVHRTIYFVVFVLSYSRYMHVSCSFEPIDTQRFIQMHDEAFRAFGGIPDELVYDQTKLVAISEKFREVIVNQRFSQYASEAGYAIRVCEGFDPESKGKVEAGVKYVKSNALYDESFRDEAHVSSYLSDWLNNVANVRIHGTTKRQPLEHYESEERAKMKPYFMVSSVQPTGQLMSRKVDKTGLISYNSVKYSVPMQWQRQTVCIKEQESKLMIYTPDGVTHIATHTLSNEKGVIVKNTNHYRDYTKIIADLEQDICSKLGETLGNEFCHKLKESAPKIYRDQLRAVMALLNKYGVPEETVLVQLVSATLLTATRFESVLIAIAKDKSALNKAKESSDETQSTATHCFTRASDVNPRQDKQDNKPLMNNPNNGLSQYDGLTSPNLREEEEAQYAVY